MKGNLQKVLVLAGILVLAMATRGLALTVTQTTNPSDLAAALGGGNLTINSVTTTNGAASQFGTYTGFTSPPQTIGNGVVMSSGQVVQVYPSFNNGLQLANTTPSTDTGISGTAEFDAYGPDHIANFSQSFNVAALQVNFTLAAASQVGFTFIFGSVEYPQYTSSYTDAFLAFLDGTAPANQIVFDSNNQAVQVGSSFQSILTTADTNTAFANPHGLMKLQTFTLNELAAGDHTIIFEVGDVNDGILDSAVFISDFHAGQGGGGTNPVTPVPSTLLLLGSGVIGLAAYARKKHSTK
jgi:hypothetical protein